MQRLKPQFMATGIIDHETGTRDMRKLNGMWRFMPYTPRLQWLLRLRWLVCHC